MGSAVKILFYKKMKVQLSDIEVDSMSKNLLLHHLRQYGAKGVSNLNLPDLRKRLKSVIKRDIDFPSDKELDLSLKQKAIEDKRKIFDDNDLLWSSELNNISIIPENFSLQKISDFLTIDPVLIDGEEVDAGTEKPTLKGRKMYLSSKIQHWEFSKNQSGMVLFRANVDASMRSELR